MIPDLIDTGLTDAEAVEALQRAHRCMTRAETEEQIGHEAAARQDADDVLTAAVSQINAALLDCASREDLNDAVGAVAALGAKNDFDIDTAATAAVANHAAYSLSGGMLSVASTGTYGRVALPYLYKKGKTVFTCTVSNFVLAGGAANIRFAQAATGADPVRQPVDVTGNGMITAEIEVNEDTQGYVIFYVNTASTSYANSADFSQIMVRRAEITDSTYAPYAPTNRELYEAKADKGTFQLTLAESPLQASEYSYSCIVTGDTVAISVRIVLAAELAVNTSRNLFFIPSPYYPPVACAGTGYADGKVRTFWVNQYGTIKIRIDEAIPEGATIAANFSYSYKGSNWHTITPASLQTAPSSLMKTGPDDPELTDAQEVTDDA